MIGMDILEIARFDLALNRSGEKFTRRILVPSEMDNNPQERWAVIFSAKESCIKLAGGMPKGASFLDIQILLTSNTSFTVKMWGAFKKSMEGNCITDLTGKWMVSPKGFILTFISS